MANDVEKLKDIEAKIDVIYDSLVAQRVLRRAEYKTSVQFDNGTPVFDRCEVVGSGDSAYITLEHKESDIGNITYDDVSDYTYSDSNKITVDENNNNRAKLKILGGESNNWPFTTPGNYTYDTDDIKVNGEASLESQEADGKFISNLRNTIDSTYSNDDGDLTGTASGGASISGNKLDLSGGTLQYLDYDGIDNIDGVIQKGCVRFLVTPDYAGSPATTQIFAAMLEGDEDTTNVVQIQHQIVGDIRAVIIGSDDVVIDATNYAAWSPNSGAEYEIEFNFDITTGAHRMFIDGVQQGSTQTTTGTRSSDIGLLRLGTNAAKSASPDFEIRDLIIYDTVQHTSNYTPSGLTPFPTTDPTIVPSTGLVFTSSLSEFVETSTKYGSDNVKYQVSSDDGTTLEWWNGAAWVSATITDIEVADSVSIIAGTPISGNLASLQALDADVYIVAEISGTPCLEVQVGYANVEIVPSNVSIYGYYDGNPAHVVNVDIYNYQTTAWVTLGQMPDDPTATVTQYDYAITGTLTDYVDGAGNSLVRMDHLGSGVPGHDLGIDYIILSGSPANEWWYDNETNTASEINTNISSLASSGTFNFKAFMHSSGGVDTPRIDNILVSSPLTFSTTDDLYVDTTDSAVTPCPCLCGWETIDITNNKPANTDIRLLLSIDSRVSWLTWNGTAWANPSSATTRTDATSVTDAEANFSALPFEEGVAGGVNVRLFLYTSDEDYSPDVSNINIVADQGYENNGSYFTDVYTPVEYASGIKIKRMIYDIDTPDGTSYYLIGKWIDNVHEQDYERYESEDDINFPGNQIQWGVEMSTGGCNTPRLNFVYVDYYTLIGVL